MDDVNVLDTSRPHGYRSFEDAHNTVGIDNITLRVIYGKAKVEKFEHIKSPEQQIVT